MGWLPLPGGTSMINLAHVHSLAIEPNGERFCVKAWPSFPAGDGVGAATVFAAGTRDECERWMSGLAYHLGVPDNFNTFDMDHRAAQAEATRTRLAARVAPDPFDTPNTTTTNPKEK